MLNHYGAWGWRRSAKARALLATLRVFEMLCMHFRVEAQDEVLGMYPGTGSTYWTTVKPPCSARSGVLVFWIWRSAAGGLSVGECLLELGFGRSRVMAGVDAAGWVSCGERDCVEVVFVCL